MQCPTPPTVSGEAVLGRWMFYVFYPLHLVVIALLRWRFWYEGNRETLSWE